MKDIVIYGAGGLGREVLWLIENINFKTPLWNVRGFLVDEDYSHMWGKEVNGIKVLGDYTWLHNFQNEIYVVCAIGKSLTRKTIYEKVEKFPNVKLATLIDPSVRIDKSVDIGKGSVICCNCIITVNIKIGNGVLLNVQSTVGHDAVIGDYSTFYMGTMIAGETKIGDCCEIGSGAFIIKGKSIIDKTTIAPLSFVINSIRKPGLYSGNPAKLIM